MLPPKNRLKNNRAFNATYKNHCIISDDNICIYLGKEKSDTSIPTRIAFVVSKKIHKRAVVRNRIKRLMREIFRLALKNNELLSVHNYISLVCVAKHKSTDASFYDFKSSIYSLLK